MDTKHYDLIVFGGGNAISTAIYCVFVGTPTIAIDSVERNFYGVGILPAILSRR